MKLKWKIFIGVLLVFVFFVMVFIQPIRTIGVMRNIASDELNDAMYRLFGKRQDIILEQLNGPLMNEGKNKNSVRFQWYKVLKWGDTASIYIEVYKYPTSLSWQDNFFWPDVSMNDHWTYIDEPISNFKDLFHDSYITYKDTSIFKFNIVQENPSDSIEYIISKERLRYLLKMGYFIVLDKQEKYVLINFYEDFASIINKKTKESKWVESAKIYIDSLNVVMMPCIISDSIRRVLDDENYNKELKKMK